MIYICIAFAIIVPYLICSINPAIIAARLKHGKDIREMGSGNPGLTNTLRTMGKSAAAVVLLFDVLKGVIAILSIRLFADLVPYDFGFFSPTALMWIGSLSAVFGHCYPVYYKFKGGKAVLVTVATGLVINWLAALIALVLFILIVLVSRYVSLGSVIAGSLYPVCVGLVGYYVQDNEYTFVSVMFSSMVALLLVFKHRANIKRLIAGTEKRLGGKNG
jgi:glycerol-3-phosphate acyltransferase PlsY